MEKIICTNCGTEYEDEDELKTVMVESEVNDTVLEELKACTECGRHEYLHKVEIKK